MQHKEEGRALLKKMNGELKERDAYEKANQSDTLEAYGFYLESFIPALFGEEATEKMRMLKQRQREEEEERQRREEAAERQRREQEAEEKRRAQEEKKQKEELAGARKKKNAKRILLFSLILALVVGAGVLYLQVRAHKIEKQKRDLAHKMEKQKRETVSIGKLMWQDDTSAETTRKKWQGAIAHCQNLSLAGHSDWRLPNIDELLSITDDTKYDPAIRSEFINVASDFYWSSSPYVSRPSLAWYVDFKEGGDVWGKESFAYLVRCVRDSK